MKFTVNDVLQCAEVPKAFEKDVSFAITAAFGTDIDEKHFTQAVRKARKIVASFKEKLTTAGTEGRCPVCGEKMETVLLRDDREVFYCRQHKIALPIRR